MMEKHRRPIDDFARVLAVILCIIPVGTYCATFVMAFLISSTGGTPPPLDGVRDGLRDIVIMVTGGAVGMAFRFASAPRQDDGKAE